MRKQVTDWEKIFIKHISDERLVSRIYEEILQVNQNNINNPVIMSKTFEWTLQTHTHKDI